VAVVVSVLALVASVVSVIVSVIYQFGDEMATKARNGEAFAIGSVIESGWKRMAYLFAVRCDDESCIAFDMRQVPTTGTWRGIPPAELPDHHIDRW
jgi:hypothetical protein